MINKIKYFHTRMKVQAEIHAQTGDNDLAYRLCDTPEAKLFINDFRLFLLSQHKSVRGGFLYLFGVYALGLKNDAFSFDEKKKFIAWLGGADCRASCDMRFYRDCSYIILSAYNEMQNFCLENNLSPPPSSEP